MPAGVCRPLNPKGQSSRSREDPPLCCASSPGCNQHLLASRGWGSPAGTAVPVPEKRSRPRSCFRECRLGRKMHPFGDRGPFPDGKCSQPNWQPAVPALAVLQGAWRRGESRRPPAEGAERHGDLVPQHPPSARAGGRRVLSFCRVSR